MNKFTIELTDQEVDLMRYLVTDMTATEIALKMDLQYFQLQNLVYKLTNVFKVRGRVGLVRTAFKLGLVTLNEL